MRQQCIPRTRRRRLLLRGACQCALPRPRVACGTEQRAQQHCQAGVVHAGDVRVQGARDVVVATQGQQGGVT